LRGVVAHWPAVRHARASAEAVARATSTAWTRVREVDALVMPPQACGRMYYNADMSGFNFTRSKAKLREINDKVLRYARFERRPTLAVQGALLADCLPQFTAQNPLPILDETVRPRIWLGGAVTTPAHFDESNNVACVVAGRRRFTLFPPEQSTTCTSARWTARRRVRRSASLRWPSRTSSAFRAFAVRSRQRRSPSSSRATRCTYPRCGFHHVESLARYNILINYWWKGAIGADGRVDSALGSLLHAILALRHLPEEHRTCGRRSSIITSSMRMRGPPRTYRRRVRGVLGEIDPALAQNLRAFLVTQLKR
jgi:hypothetical protein